MPKRPVGQARKNRDNFEICAKEIRFGGVVFIESKTMIPDEGALSLSDPPETPHQECSDAELVGRANTGDEQAFAELFRRHYGPVRGLAARILLDLAAAEDIAQETFVRAARQLGKITQGEGIRSWLYRVAANACRDRLRSQRQRRLREDEFVKLCDTRDGLPNEAAVRILEALSSLPVPQRETVVLVYYENFDHADAARVLGCAVSTISWRLMLARRRLRELLT